jgi:hypothetical protein
MAKKTDQTEPVEDAILTPATPGELIKGLIEALGADPDNVAGIDIRVVDTYARVRILGKDRSMRSRSILLGEEAADE